MSDILEIYEQLVEEEDQLVKRIHTCSEITATILYLLYQQGNTLHAPIIEEVLLCIQRMQHDLDTELLHTRLEKTVAAFNHNKAALGASKIE